MKSFPIIEMEFVTRRNQQGSKLVEIGEALAGAKPG
jgi:hypothetical protein